MIHLDPRAGSGPLLPLFQSHRLTPPTTLTQLPAADFAFVISGPDNLPTLLGIERKTLTDMLSSIRSQRLTGEQVPKLLDQYSRHAYIILEGIYKVNADTGLIQHPRVISGKKQWVNVLLGKHPVYAQEMDGALSTITEKTGIKLWHTPDEKATVDWVVAKWVWGQKEWDKHQAHMGIHAPAPYVTVGKASTVRRVGYTLSGVGWERSGGVEKEFDSVADMVGVKELIPFNTHIKRWQKIDGFGKITSEKALRELRGEHGE